MLKIHVYRGSVSESTHVAHSIVMDHNQNIIAHYGDSDLLFYPRSAIKMLQALPLITSGAADHFKLSNQEIALACASHEAEEFHVETARNWFHKLNLSEANLCCGAHWPFNEKSKHKMIEEKKQPTKIHNNCSGKHLGLLTTSLFYKEILENYFDYNHPSQKRLRAVLSELSGYDHHSAHWGIDGCGIPTYQAPLIAIAKAFAFFLNESPTQNRIINAVTENPLYIGGHEDFSSQITSQTKGDVIIKCGAEGVFCGILRSEKKVFALKVVDGAERAAEAAASFVISTHSNHKIDRPAIKNWSGAEVGQIAVSI